MVTTRAQSQLQECQNHGRSPGSRVDIDSISSHDCKDDDDSNNENKNNSSARRNSKDSPNTQPSGHRSSAELLRLEAARAFGSSPTTINASTNNNNGSTSHRHNNHHHNSRNNELVNGSEGGGGELLGRGHRVSKPTRTLDEEYLARSYYGVPEPSSTANSGHGRRSGRAAHDAEEEKGEEFVIHQRYPPRAAALRALSSLKLTLAKQDGRCNDSSDDDKDHTEGRRGESAASDGFHFQHHPEIGEKLKRREKSWRHTNSPTSDNTTSSDDNTNSSSSNSGTNSSVSSSSRSSSSFSGHGDDGKRKGKGRTRHHHSKTTSHARHHRNSGANRRAAASSASAAALSAHSSPSYATAPATGASGAGGCHKNHKRNRDSSIDSSITNDSLREPSTEELARQDEKDRKRLKGSASSDSDGSSDDGGVVTEQELRRASRHAKESTAKNININYYMKDAIGEEKKDDRRTTRHRIDRRYRHLFSLDEEEKERQNGGGGGFGSGGGGDGADSSSGGGGGGASSSSTAAGVLGDISPLKVDATVSFDSVGGLPGHIVALREMVLLPLLYPQLLKGMNLSPPRGVLFVGPPGTGKTLVARALAVEGSRCSEKRVTFFMRKGADILSKWVGESERQLKLLFEEAKRQQPSIIFFDEIDGLAPTRHTKTEQTQAALVATLLALLDGLDDRGQVVVIGATNRPDTIDPALRRPGRFDRELVFPLPDAAARRHILTILTKKQQLAGVEDKGQVLEELVAQTEGYSGADLKALCMEAGLNRLRTALPQLYTTSKKLVLPYTPTSTSLAIRKEDFFAAARRIHPSMQRGGQEMHVTRMDEHLERLFHSVRESLLSSMAAEYGAVARALAKERRDCGDLQSAVRHLSSFPIPCAKHALLLFLQVDSSTKTVSRALEGDEGEEEEEEEDRHGAVSVNSGKRGRTKDTPSRSSSSSTALFPTTTTTKTTRTEPSASAVGLAAARQMILTSTCVSVMRGLPSFQTFMVHLPHVQVSFHAMDASAIAGAEGGGISGQAAVGSPYAAVGSGGGGFTGGHMYQLVQAVQRSSPCIVLLRGAEEWLRERGLGTPGLYTSNSPHEEVEEEEVEETERVVYPFSAEELQERASRMAAFHYYMGLLADTEAILLIPCATDDTRRTLLGQRFSKSTTTITKTPSTTQTNWDVKPVTHIIPTGQHQLHPHFTVLRTKVLPTPTADDLAAFVSYVYRIVTLAFRVQSVMAQRSPGSRRIAHGGGGGTGGGALRPPPPLQLDTAPRSSTAMLSKEQQRAQYQQALALWRKVEYRRLQLRHVLLKWVGQYVTQTRFKVLLTADLDLHPENPLYKSWRRHTKHSRIGLDDVFEKLEREKYVCLSQFHDDIDQLVRNVRSFFRSRGVVDQRYRMKALELKETTVLNMYKINRSVVRFCETHRKVKEPKPLSDDDEDDEEGDEASAGRNNNSDSDNGEESDPDDALRFSQRPAAPARPKRKYRVFGQRRRRRPAPRRQPAVTTAEEVAHVRGKNNDDGGEEEENAVAAVEGSDTRTRKHGGTKSPSEGQQDEQRGEAEGAVEEEGQNARPHSRVGFGKTNSSSNSRSPATHRDSEHLLQSPPHPLPSPLSPVSPLYPPDKEVEAWAVALLTGLPYDVLQRVFQMVMQRLDAEVRRRDGYFDAPAPSSPSQTALTLARESEKKDGNGPAVEDSPQPKPTRGSAGDGHSHNTHSKGNSHQRSSPRDGERALRTNAEGDEQGEEEEGEEGAPLESAEMFLARNLTSAVGQVRQQPY